MKHLWLLPLIGFAFGLLTGAWAFADRPPTGPEPGAGAAVTLAESEPSDHPAAALAGADAASPSTRPPGAAPEPAPVPEAGETARLAAALDAWRRLEAEVTLLQARLASVEQTLATRTLSGPEPERPEPPRTAEERREALVSAGVDVGLADDIIWRDSRIELDRLALRDLAVREGWMGSDRYREELRAINADQRSLREDIGDDAWDRFLYVTGADNRIAIDSIIPGSAAEAAGLRPGDLIESYAGERLFSFGEIREATTQGEAGELVPVRVQRGNGVVEAWVPRGPLGVRMDSTRIEPRS